MTAAVRQSLLVRDELDHSGSDSELDDLDKSLGFEEFHLMQHRHYLSFEGVGTGNPAEKVTVAVSLIRMMTIFLHGMYCYRNCNIG